MIDVVTIIIIVIAYLPITMNFQKRIRQLEDEVASLRKRR